MVTARCHTCGQDREFKHVHDTAHGIPGTHMAGSERFTCTTCGESIFAAEAYPPFQFVLDTSEAPK